MIKNCLFISHLTLLCIMHLCFPHQGDLILRDDISLRHLTFNNTKCNVYGTCTLKPPGLKISQNDSSFLNFFFYFLMASIKFIWKLNTSFLINYKSFILILINLWCGIPFQTFNFLPQCCPHLLKIFEIRELYQRFWNSLTKKPS